ncbi:MAG: hypothetical protein U9O54_02970 [Chloroflexota bacterium]|nr:hypothetical protein [Chloroflexota bacterium]
MKKIIHQLRERKFQAHLAVFLAVMFSSLGLYFAAQQENTGAMWGLLAIVVLGNLLAVIV